MKNLFLLLAMVAVVSSCGSKKSNNVDSGSVSTNNNNNGSTNGLETAPAPLANFEGSYYIARNSQGMNCPTVVNITRACQGYTLASNLSDRNEDFCNINQGEARRGSPDDRNPPNPDRNPPNPDRVVVVTQQANELKSVVRIGQAVYTNTLTLDSNNNLIKDTIYKSRGPVHCVFQKH